jgi:hypothetical protein
MSHPRVTSTCVTCPIAMPEPRDRTPRAAGKAGKGPAVIVLSSSQAAHYERGGASEPKRTERVLIAATSRHGGGKDGERAVRVCESRTVRGAAPFPSHAFPRPRTRRSFAHPQAVGGKCRGKTTPQRSFGSGEGLCGETAHHSRSGFRGEGRHRRSQPSTPCKRDKAYWVLCGGATAEVNRISCASTLARRRSARSTGSQARPGGLILLFILPCVAWPSHPGTEDWDRRRARDEGSEVAGRYHCFGCNMASSVLSTLLARHQSATERHRMAKVQGCKSTAS